LVYPDNG